MDRPISPKMSAAISAVMFYIQSEQEAIVQAGIPAAPAAMAPPPAPFPKLWGISGRQEMMQMRNMMQMKAFHGIRAR